jgi:thioredoxin-like negative regulator of GroEL
LAGAQAFEESLEVLLTLVPRDRKGVGEKARQLMVEIFQALPADSEVSTRYRRKLSMALY